MRVKDDVLKLHIYGCAIAIAQPVLAQELTQDFLEQPGMIWVATELPLPVQEGLVLAMAPYIQFEAGQVESGFFTGAPRFWSPDCEELFECRDVTQMATVFAGPYTLDGNTITSAGGPTGDWMVEREESHLLAITSDAMYGGSALFERDGETLIQTRPEGPRTYVALPSELLFAPVNLPFFNGESMALTYECSVRAVADLAATQPADRTEQQTQLAAYLRIAAGQMSRDNELGMLNPIWLEQDLSDADQLRVDQLRREMMVASMFGLISAGYDADKGEVSAESLDQVSATFPVVQAAAPDAEAMQTLYNALLPDMVLAAPLAADFRRADDAGLSGIETVLCSG